MIKVKEKNGKQYIYQYDTGREVIITPEEGYTVDSIEYFNNTTDLAPIGIIREVDGVLLSYIPNSFLQSENTIQVYLVMHDEEERQTIEYKDITVIPRAKPADYVLEPDAVLTWHSLDERLKILEEGGTDGGMNKEQLQEAVNTALTQAKESGEFDGTNGTTPHIGANGNWFIGDEDTGVSATGETTSITVDDKLNKESTNPIQNKTVAEEVDRLSEEIVDKIGQTELEEEVENQLEGAKGDIVTDLIAHFGNLPVFGKVESDNTVTVQSMLADGTYTLKYENADGTTTEIGKITVGTGEGEGSGGNGDGTGGEITPPDTTLTWSIGTKLDSSTGAESSSSSYTASNPIEIVDGYTYTLNRTSFKYDVKVCYYDENNNFLSTTASSFINTDDGLTSATIPLIAGAKYFRLRVYFGGGFADGTVGHTSLMSTTITATK